MILAFFAVAIVPAGQLFRCTPVRVWDGDGPVWCAEGPRVRLAGIAAREIDGSCRRGQPCPMVSGIAARDALVALLGGPLGRTRAGHVLVRGPVLQCRSAGPGKGDRTAARCLLPSGESLGCALVRRRVALAWRRFGGC